MVTDAIIGVLCSLFSWLIGLFPHITLPDWLTSLGTTIGGAISNVNAFAYFIPLNAIGNVVVLLLAVSAAVLAIRLFRMVLSLFTGGGGNLS